MKYLPALILFFCLHLAAFSADQGTQLTVTRDNSIDLYPSEEDQNAGKQNQIRIKGNQHLVALAFDTAPLKGRKIKSATLVCFQGEKKIDHVTISTIQSDWDEYKSNALTSGMQEKPGWGEEGARFPAVTDGNSFSLVCQSASELKNGAYYWQVAPDLINACSVGASFGLTIHESSVDYSRNPTIYSREEKKKGPYLTVTFADDDPVPGKPEIIKVANTGSPDGLRLFIKAPSNGFAYEVKVNGKDLPRWNIPFVVPITTQIIPIRDMDLKPGEPLAISISTISRTGRKTDPLMVNTTYPKPEKIAAPKLGWPNKSAGKAPVYGIIPLEDKYNASGKAVGDVPEDYLKCNEVFDGETIRLSAARGEVVGFQALLTGKDKVTAKCEIPEMRTDLYQALYVETPNGKIPDPLVPLNEVQLSENLPTPVCVDVYVPFDFSSKEVKGSFSLSNGLTIPVEIKIRDFSLPMEASFSCEMNSYGLPNAVKTYYQLQQIAYDHRAHCNILCYSHGTAAPGARKCNMDMLKADGTRMNEKMFNDIKPGTRHIWWDDFTAVFGPYLSGQYFKNAHRGVIPAPGFYLPFHESWPLNVRAFFDGNPDAYEAFKKNPMYVRTFTDVMRDFIKDAKVAGWIRTGFQVYFNNKGKLDDPKLAPWVFDEPASFWDYRALAYYSDLVKQSNTGENPLPIKYRIDISRPEFERGQLYEKAKLWVVNLDAFKKYHRILLDRSERTGEEYWTYGSSNNVEDSSHFIQAWALESYLGGAKGIVPWQTISRGKGSLEKGDQLAIFTILEEPGQEPAVYHSLRLKAYRRAQQDIEYLEILKNRLNLSPWQVSAFVNSYLMLGYEVYKKNEDDAGTPKFKYVSPENFRRMREAAAELIEKAKPVE